MSDYVKAHWRGELSLARSYWVNVILLSLLFAIVAEVVPEGFWPQGAELRLLFGLILVGLASVVTVWQFVGVWRSATNRINKTGRALWPGMAKLAVIVGWLVGGSNVIMMTSDLVRALGTVRQSDLADHLLERLGETDLIFKGAINDTSATEIIHALNDPSITILRVDSHGGLIEPAIRLARHIHDNQVMVMAEEHCISACVILLAASPFAAISPTTKVSFHRAEPLVEFATPELRRESELYLSQVENETEQLYREFGIAQWAIDTAKRQPYWTPTIDQQIRMGLIAYVYDVDHREFVAASDYCIGHQEQCL